MYVKRLVLERFDYLLIITGGPAISISPCRFRRKNLSCITFLCTKKISHCNRINIISVYCLRLIK